MATADLAAMREQLLREREALAAQNESLKQELAQGAPSAPESAEATAQRQLRELREQLLAQNAALKQQQMEAQNSALDRAMAQLLRQSSAKTSRPRRSSSKKAKWRSDPLASSLVSIAEGEEDDSGASTAPSSSTSLTGSVDLNSSVQTCLSDDEVDGGAETRTTLMLRDLPTTLSTQDLVAVLAAEGFGDLVDFAYMPADFNTGTSFGYAIVNIQNAASALRFRESFDNFRAWGSSQSSRPCSVSWNAARQGLEALQRRYWDVEDMCPASRPYLRGC